MNLWTVEQSALPVKDPEALARIFTLGNGAIGTPATVPLAPRGSWVTLMGGLYGEGTAYLHWVPHPGHPARDNAHFPTDHEVLSRYTLLSFAVCPDVFALRLWWDGEPLTPGPVERALDLEAGLLRFRVNVPLPGGTVTLESRRFVSWDDHRLLAEELTLTASVPGRLLAAFELDAARKNTFGNQDVWAAREARREGDTLLYLARAAGTGQRLAVAMQVSMPAFQPAPSAPVTEAPDIHLAGELAAGEPVQAVRFVAMASDVLDPEPQPAAREACRRAAAAGFDACRRRHAERVAAFWKAHDIRIEGSAEDQISVRYAVFQLGNAIPPNTDRFSFGAKFLSGEWYRGCLFWDTDIYVAPYFTKRDPAVARQHLRHRHRGLPAARAIAKAHGQKGARYPWEAYPSGEDATPVWLVLAETQIHVVADVAWGVVDYYRWTGDDDFVRTAGAEMLEEIARFWMSRVTLTERGAELRDVCGPDEFHMCVANSVYVATLAVENLVAAAEHGRSASAAERQAWRDMAARIVVQPPNAAGVIPQFDGFLELPDPLPETGEAEAPGYQLLKQADFIVLPVLLPERYSPEAVDVNYRYYEPRTQHGSTLSLGMHGLVAATLGRTDEAYRMFQRTAYADLHNTMGSASGLHAACTAMIPRTVMEGFAGLRIVNGKPVAVPHLPDGWTEVEFQFVHRGRPYLCRVTASDRGRTVPCAPANQ